MTDKSILTECNIYAKNMSTCCKAQVGCLVYLGSKCISSGYNLSMPTNCKKYGCHRVDVYGEDSKNHRLPSDCYALHSEIMAIALAARNGDNLLGADMYISRYPCEACARAIVASGINKVIYGGIEEISEQTKEIFKNNGVEVEFIYTPWGGDTVE